MPNLTEWTPSQVDVALAEIYDADFDLRLKMHHLGRLIDAYAKNIDRYAAGELRFSGYTKTSLDDMVTRLTEMHDKQDALRVAMLPYQEEFIRRGGWTRAWLVDNAGGHVHRSMDCSTCFETTRFGWLPQVSGLDEDEIIAQAGEKACTVCYPSAPAEVLNNPSALELPKRREERLAREAERAEKAAAKAAKSLSLDGSVVKLHWDGEALRLNWMTNKMEPTVTRGWKELKTYRAAELFVVDALAGTGYEHPTTEVVDEVIEMMAAKRGTTVTEIREPLAAKAAKKASQR